MSKMNDLSLQVVEAGIPAEVYEEMTVADALRLVNDDKVQIEKVNGKWQIADEVTDVE